MTDAADDTMKVMLSAAPPLKRLTRPSVLPPLRICARDIAIVSAVARYRFLDSGQISQLDGGSHAQVLRRLKALWAHGFLDRPRHQHAYLAAFGDEGNHALVYGLGRLGVRLLAETGVAVNDKLSWTQKNSRAGAPFLAHTIETAQAMIHFAAAAHAAGLRLIDHHELLPLLPEKTRALKNPFCARVSFSLPKQRAPRVIGVAADRLFSIAHGDARRNYALELDRGTMDINARSLAKASFRRKLLGYFHLWKQGLHAAQWNMKSFRVLTITNSMKRIEHMIAAQNDVTNGTATGLFLYSLPSEIARHGALGPAWLNATGERITLIDGETH